MTESTETAEIAALRVEANAGDADAQFRLGNAYDRGQGVPQDYGQAVTWYRQAAEQGVAVAQNNLGAMYHDGQGVPQDSTQAVAWYRKAAEQGDAAAQFNLGLMYGNGQGVPKDYVEGYKWHNLAASRVSAENQKRYAETRDALARLMTPTQIEAAHKRATAELLAGLNYRRMALLFVIVVSVLSGAIILSAIMTPQIFVVLAAVLVVGGLFGVTMLVAASISAPTLSDSIGTHLKWQAQRARTLGTMTFPVIGKHLREKWQAGLAREGLAGPDGIFLGIATGGLWLLLMVPQSGYGYVAVQLAPQRPWAYYLRYSSEDGMRGAVVTVDARPHNCAFMAAPLGSKNCHYKPNVATIRVRTSTASRAVSFDEGRTWIPSDGSTQPAVWVTWEKVED